MTGEGLPYQCHKGQKMGSYAVQGGDEYIVENVFALK